MNKKRKSAIIDFAITVLAAIVIVYAPQYGVIYWISKIIFYMALVDGLKRLFIKNKKDDKQETK
ncbi:hypothetical protein [Thermoanaerobacterium thermosaccharolyticum]|jgi:hypothetical protein|uniref:hypothetical protein n=1 Tax=Thermoanaerobacterium thermosaccharolyticum TaxID=1517 RepID=UPI00178212C8|nr:hypothetical protein [Thermoanaerobacterium thermosaccharolyticum]MBE0069854.1 hypothetical protein [Thermoanaerobacterium thermosaccharolyticum]MBE0227481.1 hypothetical protein [Thermoanaerobacterium thermosaccharolyticum]